MRNAILRCPGLRCRALGLRQFARSRHSRVGGNDIFSKFGFAENRDLHVCVVTSKSASGCSPVVFLQGPCFRDKTGGDVKFVLGRFVGFVVLTSGFFLRSFCSVSVCVSICSLPSHSCPPPWLFLDDFVVAAVDVSVLRKGKAREYVFSNKRKVITRGSQKEDEEVCNATKRYMKKKGKRTKNNDKKKKIMKRKKERQRRNFRAPPQRNPSFLCFLGRFR